MTLEQIFCISGNKPFASNLLHHCFGSNLLHHWDQIEPFASNLLHHCWEWTFCITGTKPFASLLGTNLLHHWDQIEPFASLGTNLLYHIKERHKHVCIVVASLSLYDRTDALQAHSCVHIELWQNPQATIWLPAWEKREKQPSVSCLARWEKSFLSRKFSGRQTPQAKYPWQ